ncbi:hypothetical protein E8E15_005641 [Penicillium rubens]|uniref:Pc20g11700 protein n=2 Tax=Penicillium chrysogenum species complex TaxID=254878 RepID=B6HGA4_PENRW|nr:uncharacterized protein N7525_009555 [Penicillium rubens]XP_056573214.1 uncharacterized protein N7489_003157 [Penicillium chrysogenum]CAP86499.1 Pc20g11700 [Penicillium rubens Wisconsin 54-1255]KAF3026993.1 hypothetical protein E8E15_005641 [Penicillium rubens]KAJ5053340.1 hypothetical protein NUH16_010410 [Penicillium rubens]KAJ5252747.1 hypothetical protein N7489_003157 [Penicillium chrysogenum]KAJ5259981.1 hypothetical protein N7505_009362 [Penicillium chrysogenum]
MHLQTLLLSLTLTLTIQTTATPIPISLFTRDTALTESQLITIAPSSKSCANAPAEGECATAKQAAKFTSQSFNTYKVTSKAEQAAIVSLMAFETEDFKYNKNHFPGVAGQGTRNMQSPAYNKKYASSLPELKDKLPSVSNSPEELLDLLRSDSATDFGSGAWFLTTQCSKDVRTALADGSETGWQRFISDCVGTSVTDERKEYWERAVKAIGV